ncbi:antitoxin Xre/MbcA/ParS toxin-binding domain-containing protein [Alteromonas sp. 14N.309.X.WAT.G.H12]|uniref:antitoxin Xre/MbcA/ParS toxin-binding domain-containing protein n=1 Tax=Alteromonas sp. 14N.309.X.WAT.G.H12 TaxID=3120824 RepID=UPI002FD23A24
MKVLTHETIHTSIKQLFPDTDIMSPTGYLSAVRAGVSGQTLRKIINILGEREWIAKAIGKDVSNLSKSYKLKRLSPMVSDNLIDTLRVFIQAVSIYESLDLAKEWMSSPIPALGGEIPVTLLDTHAGREIVRQALKKLEFGEFV